MTNEKSTYEDYKYFMQDVGSIYIGCKYTLQEIMDNDEITFRFRRITADDLAKDRDPEDTLETLLYYLTAQDFTSKLFKRMGTRVKVSVLREKKSFFGGKQERVYRTEEMSVDELTALSPDEKERLGIVIQEIKISKLMLASV
jgi:hypothetical protein